MDHVHRKPVPADRYVPLVEFMYLVFTRMPGESYRRRLRSLLLCLCYVFRALITSLVCWSCRWVFVWSVLFQDDDYFHRHFGFSNLCFSLGCSWQKPGSLKNTAYSKKESSLKKDSGLWQTATLCPTLGKRVQRNDFIRVGRLKKTTQLLLTNCSLRAF